MITSSNITSTFFEYILPKVLIVSVVVLKVSTVVFILSLNVSCGSDDASQPSAEQLKLEAQINAEKQKQADLFDDFRNAIVGTWGPSANAQASLVINSDFTAESLPCGTTMDIDFSDSQLNIADITVYGQPSQTGCLQPKTYQACSVGTTEDAGFMSIECEGQEFYFYKVNG